MAVVTLFLSWSQNTVMMSLFPGLPYCLMGCHQGPGIDFQVGAVPLLNSEKKKEAFTAAACLGEQDGSLESQSQCPPLICQLYSFQLGKRTPWGIPSKSRQLALLRSAGLQAGVCRVKWNEMQSDWELESFRAEQGPAPQGSECTKHSTTWQTAVSAALEIVLKIVKLK